jgi:PAS domain S-box-containing protein
MTILREVGVSALAAATLEDLSRRTAILDAISYAAARMVGSGDWKAGVQELLDRLGHATGVSRVTLFEAHPGPDGRLVQSCRFDWAEEGLDRLSGDPRYTDQSLADEGSPDELGEWSRRRQRGEVVAATLGEVTGYTREVFLEHKTLSFVSVPVMLPSGGWWGFLGFDDCKVERIWSPLEIDVLRTAATLIAAAIERERAGERLRVSEERYDLAARGANDGLWDWDIDAGTAYFSPRLHEILGMAEGSLEGSRDAFLDQFTLADGRPMAAALEERFVGRRRKFELEVQHRRPAHSPRWYVARGLIVYRDGAPARVVGSFRDISDRKVAEGRLRSSEARLRAILETANDAVISIDEAGRIVEFNPAAERIFGYSRSWALGRSMCGLLVPPHLRAAHEAGFARYLATGQARILGRLLELEALAADGRTFPVELSVTELSLEGRRLFTAIIRDITDRKRVERQLQEAEAKRASLARYFSPNLVEDLMRSDRDLGVVRSQEAAVLFCDMIGFSRLSAATAGDKVIELLREFHAIIEDAVFRYEGTLDKYMGDGMMATFGTPRTGRRDATHALACARSMVAAIVAWSRRRQSEGRAAIEIGVGLHFGEVTLGDVGSERRPEFTVVGDTVNVASRIEDLTRTLDVAILASQALIDAVRAEGGEELLTGLIDMGWHTLRGRGGRVRLWGETAVTVSARAAVAPPAAKGS